MDIVVSHVYKSYNGLLVLEDVCCRFPEGKTSCIMGESGCGKTTLLRMILGLELPDSGVVSGVPAERLSAVFQEDRLCANLSVEANIRLVCGRTYEEEEIHSAMEEMRLEEAFHRPIRELSGGMKRRAAILRALLAESECIVMDEPLVGLDEETKEAVLKVIRRRAKGKTMLVVTHDREEPELFGAENIMMMKIR